MSNIFIKNCLAIVFLGLMMVTAGGCGTGEDVRPVEPLNTKAPNVANVAGGPTATPELLTEINETSVPTTTLPTELSEAPATPLAQSPLAGPTVSMTLADDVKVIPGSEPALAAAVADLSAKIGVSPDRITLVSVEAGEWSDASLGCPQEGFMYAQVVTPGYLIIFAVDGSEYKYHTNQQDVVVHCAE
jgi:hypothetical protein